METGDASFSKDAGAGIMPDSRHGLEKTDSCYDSDDNDEGCLDSAGNITRIHKSAENTHRDVSRTVSETLKEEYEAPSLTKNASSDDPCPFYRIHLSFALKLGFTEEQVQKALGKLGNQISQNELLAELITLGANGTMDEKSEEEDTELGYMGADDVPVSSDCVTRDRDSTVGFPYNKILANNQCDAVGSASGNSSKGNLRHVVIDGSNVAFSHGNKGLFSCRGIQLCVDYFRQRGHKEITVFVPQWRKESSRPDAPIKDQEILLQLEREGLLTFTPSRYVGNRRLVCYDDRYVVKLAMETDGIIVSNDTYRDLIQENVDYRKVVEERLLMYSFVNDRFMPPDDPLGRHGPTLEQFLKRVRKRGVEFPERLCPYGKKCTYGNKCKYAHPERGNQPQKSVAESIEEKARAHMQQIETRERKQSGENTKAKLSATLSSPVPRSPTHKPIHRTHSNRFQGDQSSSGMFNPSAAAPNSACYLRVPSPSPIYRPASVDTAERLARQMEHMYVSNNRNTSFPFQGFSGPSHIDVGRSSSSPMEGMHRPHRPLGPTLSDQSGNGNMHNKVARQLSLNPYGNSQMGYQNSPRRASVNPIAQVSSRITGDFTGASGQNGFRPLVGTNSDPSYQFGPVYSQNDFHAGSTESVLNPCAPPFTPFFQSSAAQSPFAMHGFDEQQTLSSEESHPSHSQDITESQRYEVYNRLCMLFPANQVEMAMACYPNEYNVHKLCSAIIHLFPVGGEN